MTEDITVYCPITKVPVDLEIDLKDTAQSKVGCTFFSLDCFCSNPLSEDKSCRPYLDARSGVRRLVEEQEASTHLSHAS
jgi:hypothetical protein